ncbi:hypothetical protein Hanom_Chr08g00757061 [Helianthus anomalus]
MREAALELVLAVDEVVVGWGGDETVVVAYGGVGEDGGGGVIR